MAGHNQQRQAVLVSSSRSEEMLFNDISDKGIALHSIERLVQVGQALLDQPHNVCAYLADAVVAITRDCARLIFDTPAADAERLAPSKSVFASFPVRCGMRTYGTLSVSTDTEHPEFPSIPLAVAHLLAEICGLLLHNLEQSALLSTQSQHLGERAATEPLTAREREILKLICQGYSELDIVATLTISPNTVSKHRQHIYEKLGVHNEREVRLVAYCNDLVSFLE